MTRRVRKVQSQLFGTNLVRLPTSNHHILNDDIPQHVLYCTVLNPSGNTVRFLGRKKRPQHLLGLLLFNTPTGLRATRRFKFETLKVPRDHEWSLFQSFTSYDSITEHINISFRFTTRFLLHSSSLHVAFPPRVSLFYFLPFHLINIHKFLLPDTLSELINDGTEVSLDYWV